MGFHACPRDLYPSLGQDLSPPLRSLRVHRSLTRAEHTLRELQVSVAFTVNWHTLPPHGVAGDPWLVARAAWLSLRCPGPTVSRPPSLQTLCSPLSAQPPSLPLDLRLSAALALMTAVAAVQFLPQCSAGGRLPAWGSAPLPPELALAITAPYGCGPPRARLQCCCDFAAWLSTCLSLPRDRRLGCSLQRPVPHACCSCPVICRVRLDMNDFAPCRGCRGNGSQPLGPPKGGGGCRHRLMSAANLATPRMFGHAVPSYLVIAWTFTLNTRLQPVRLLVACCPCAAVLILARYPSGRFHASESARGTDKSGPDSL